ncbi:MAG: hypothetical protein LIP03_00875 [Bacteroidales bacterium]|nr:hypothetical protein [Bacteroidales bacterium]
MVGAIDLYLLCMYCGGLELDEFFALAPEAIKSDPPRLHLPWAGIDIELSPTVYNALLQGRETAPRSPATITRALEALDIDLYKSQSVFSDWLRFAKDIGISDQAILEMLELRRHPGAVASPQLAEAIRMVVKRMNQAYNKYKKQWYCLYVHRGWAKEKCEEILTSDPPVLPGIAARSEDFYYPNTANVKMAKLKGQKLQDPGKVLRRYLFVHCYLSEIQTIARKVPRVSVLSRREGGLREYVAIPSHEVYTLKLMLDNLRGSEAELMLQDEDIVEAIDLSPLHEQERVRIVSPGYEDYEAVIAKVKPNSTYSVTFPNLGLSFTLQNVPRALIQRLP